jgi:Mg-chelatase subunit ChlD
MSTIALASVWPLLLLSALPLIWWLARRKRAAVERGRLLSATVLRSAVFVAIAAALTQPVLQRASDAVSVVYALDVSGSVSPRFVREALGWIGAVDARHEPAQSRYVVFADRARLLDSLEQVRAIAVAADDDTGARGDTIHQGATDLEEALLAALPGFAPGHAKRIVLLSDGNETEGDVWRAMLRVQAEGARVFAVPAGISADKDAWIQDIIVPEEVREDTEVELEVRLSSRLPAPARVELSIGERTAGSQDVTLSQGDNRVTFKVRFPREGSQDITARVSADGDEIALNDTLVEDVLVKRQLRVLYVEGGADAARHLAGALSAQAIRVSVATPGDLSGNPRLIEGNDVVILSDVRADALGASAAQRLHTFVRDDGGGLVFAAGENTYGENGFAGGALERLLPVKFEAKRKRQDLDIVLLIDRSSSMRRGKIEFAKTAALATLDLLEPEQGLGVVAFDAKQHVIVPLAPVGDKRRAAELISRMTSSGQTNIYGALQEAQRQLADSKAEIKHIILLSDGLTAPPSNEVIDSTGRGRRGRVIVLDGTDIPKLHQKTELVAQFEGIMEELSEAKITLSSVVFGEGPDIKFMTALAKMGHGQTHISRSEEDLPSLFAGETRRIRGDSVVEEPFTPLVKASSPTISGVDFATGPKLKGYVESKPKRFSDVLLEAKKDLPLLAETHYGLGKTVVFLSDVKNRWAVDWLDWPGYAKLWGQIVRDSARRDAGDGVTWKVTREGRSADIQLTALGSDGSYRSDLVPQVRVTAPAGGSTVTSLRQVAPGRYTTQVPLAASGDAPWNFELLPGGGVSATDIERAGTRRLFYTYPDEYRLLSANLPLLRTLSEQTGGSLSPGEDEIFKPRGDGGLRVTPLWPYFAGAALLLFLLDILVRRAPWSWRRGR